MSCCLTACERWKLERRGYVPMDIFNARQCSGCCSCGSISSEEASEENGSQSCCGCSCENNCCG